MKNNSFNTKRLPPIPDFIPTEKHALFRQCWREFHRYWRWQKSEDQRFWLTCAHTVGFEVAEKHLGPDESFQLLVD